jgi:hypothetical protein
MMKTKLNVSHGYNISKNRKIIGKHYINGGCPDREELLLDNNRYTL